LNSNQAFEAYYHNVLSRRESEALNLNGFEQWDIPQIDFTYEQLEMENQIAAMATYVDLNSEPIPLGTKGVNVLRGSIPRQKARFIIGENDYRKQMMIMERLNSAARLTGGDAQGNVKAYLTKLLFGGLSEIQDAHISSLNFQVGQMKSAGKVALTDANNPRGIRNVEFSAYIPTANITTLTTTARWFTNDAKTTEGSASDPVNDVKKLVRTAKERYDDVVLEVDELSFFEDMKHSKWQIALGYAMMPTLMAAGKNAERDASAAAVAAGASDEAVKAAFKAVVGVEVIFNKSVCGVEKWNNETKALVRTKIRAFNANTYLARPSGNIGIIKNVVPLRPDSSAISAMIFNNHGIIEYRYDAKHKVQDWCSELTALAVPTRPSDMFYLYTK
jgi:hypothetical protein